MNNRTGLLSFFVLVIVFVFTFVFCLDALAKQVVEYGVLALIGYLVCVVVSLLMGGFARKNGEALAVWYFAYTIVVSIVFVWYLTRCGTAFSFWT